MLLNIINYMLQIANNCNNVFRTFKNNHGKTVDFTATEQNS